MNTTKQFLSKDHSGRGENPAVLTLEHLQRFWQDSMDETDDDGEQTLSEFLEECEPGDVWRNGTESLEYLGEQ